jgi:hypothetical protein
MIVACVFTPLPHLLFALAFGLPCTILCTLVEVSWVKLGKIEATVIVPSLEITEDLAYFGLHV